MAAHPCSSCHCSHLAPALGPGASNNSTETPSPSSHRLHHHHPIPQAPPSHPTNSIPSHRHHPTPQALSPSHRLHHHPIPQAPSPSHRHHHHPTGSIPVKRRGPWWCTMEGISKKQQAGRIPAPAMKIQLEKEGQKDMTEGRKLGRASCSPGDGVPMRKVTPRAQDPKKGSQIAASAPPSMSLLQQQLQGTLWLCGNTVSLLHREGWAGWRMLEGGSICLAAESAVTSPARPWNQDGPLRAGTGHFKGKFL